MRALKKLIYRWISDKYMDGCSNYNSLSVRKNSRSKRQAREMFASKNFPHAKGDIFFSPLKALKFAREHGYPLVIKPNVSGYSRGSHFPIRNEQELWKAALLVKIWWPTSIIEQYLEGANYRVLATPDEIVSVIRRYPPFVDGNGSDSISVLIDAENQIRTDMALPPTIHLIEKSSGVVGFLKKQQLSLESVPKRGERIYLFNRVALAPGGVVEIIDQSTIPPVNKALFHEVVKAFDANLFGVDVIFEHGIEKSYKDQKCIMLEVNSRPYIKMHHKPRFGEAENLQPFFDRMDAMQIPDTDIF
ncbi:MAG: cyanophycin synthetase [Gammaproteobacteria bacterium]|nr:cyanophycin synthetase [Gammaproteobacteria bacterium]